MSYPAASLVASNAVPRHQQGIAASLVNTFVNYAISLGLGFAGTVETQVNNGGKTPDDILKGYRAAWYLGIGLAGLGILLALLNLWLDIVDGKKGKDDDAEANSEKPREMYIQQKEPEDGRTLDAGVHSSRDQGMHGDAGMMIDHE